MLVRLSTCSSLLSSRQLILWMFSSSRHTDSLLSPQSVSDGAGGGPGGRVGNGGGSGGGGSGGNSG